MNRGDLITRFDAFYHNPYFCLLEKQLSEVQHPVISLRKISDSFTNGDHGGVKYVDKGVRYLRGQSVTEEGLNLKDELYISTNDHERMIRAEVIPGDVLLTIAGSIGNCCVVEGVDKANINQAIVKIRPSPSTIDPNFLSFFLNSKYGKFQTSRLANGAVQLNVNFSEAGDIKIIVPSLPEQYRLVTAMDEARSQRKQKLAEANVLLSSLDDYLLKTLGLEPPVKDERKVFAIQTSIISGRFDPHFHAPNFKNIYRLLFKTTTKILGEIVQFSKDSWNPKDEEKSTFRYIEISNVKPQTGEAIWTETLTKEVPSRARMLVHGDDIIVSLTRPHHGSIAHLSEEFDGCIASTGFAIIRSVSKLVNREYLWCILRSQLSLQQMLQRSSGGNYPAITKTELENIIIPIPEISIQEQIVAEIQRRRSESQRLRSEAESGWQAAKQWFEEQLLGGS
ncbi:restriction endonuclease subunit S [Dolichospermum lemmermannii CS-548]|jgi:type I restriction enzyme S subunit|uniref:restriction endonuclease subunit S n=1 Tax=Dolichospermum lemmermannii TaxID=54295 RepID=UPI00232B1E38|nr:restriction endonuclease subunit S [Dolichospermum lemmermannii]MDB9436899.1 restriction endonuclease subunit S [Dolichospermum lemmermannii CS-548]